MNNICFVAMGFILFSLVSVSGLSVTVHVPEKYHEQSLAAVSGCRCPVAGECCPGELMGVGTK